MIKFKFRDKLGWPVERIIGRPITNFLRLLIHTNIRRTWIMRNHNDMPSQPNANICCAGKGVPMILMPELCYYCREELNFGDMALHDGHRVHKKCLPPINDTNMWDEAARKAMLSSAAFPDRFTLARKMSVNDILQTLSDEGGKSDDYLLDFAVKIEPIIAKHHADLRATYDAILQLAVATREMFALQPMAYDANESGWLTYCEDKAALELRVDAKLADPLVQAAIERSKKV